MKDRLTPEEVEVFRTLRQWWNHRTIQNLDHLKNATKAWIRENKK